MSATVAHDHVPIFRVIRRGWPDALDASFSQRPGVDNRWNTADFAALYCCCSEAVARAIVSDIFRLTGADIDDLNDEYKPQLVEIDWTGDLVDAITAEGVASLGFAADYPVGTGHSETRAKAVTWHASGGAGVVCRSSSISRLGFRDWIGDHAAWSELAIYTDNCPRRPSEIRRREDLDWLAA